LVFIHQTNELQLERLSVILIFFGYFA